jgi:hypothetical protein
VLKTLSSVAPGLTSRAREGGQSSIAPYDKLRRLWGPNLSSNTPRTLLDVHVWPIMTSLILMASGAHR